MTEDIESLSFNTAISQMMIFVNAFIPQGGAAVPISAMRTFLVLLNPFAPHITSELWERLSLDGHIASQSWPSYDEAVLVENEVEIPVQLNGKFRGCILEQMDAPEEQVRKDAIVKVFGVEASGQVGITKVIVKPNKLVNIVTIEKNKAK